MEITECASWSSSLIESHARVTIRIVAYRLQFVQDLGDACVEFAGVYSRSFGTYVMDARSRTSIVHFFSVAVTCVGS